MNPIAIKPPKNHNPGYGDLRTMAERELAAFFRAVAELFGPEEAELAAEDWLGELVATHGVPDSARQWRRITLNASARLATRLNALSMASALA